MQQELWCIRPFTVMLYWFRWDFSPLKSLFTAADQFYHFHHTSAQQRHPEITVKCKHFHVFCLSSCTHPDYYTSLLPWQEQRTFVSLFPIQTRWAHITFMCTLTCSYICICAGMWCSYFGVIMQQYYIKMKTFSKNVTLLKDMPLYFFSNISVLQCAYIIFFLSCI